MSPPQVHSRGLELEARAELNKQFWLTGSFAALNMKILSSAIFEELGNTPILTPKQTGALRLSYAANGSGAQRHADSEVPLVGQVRPRSTGAAGCDSGR